MAALTSAARASGTAAREEDTMETNYRYRGGNGYGMDRGGFSPGFGGSYGATERDIGPGYRGAGAYERGTEHVTQHGPPSGAFERGREEGLPGRRSRWQREPLTAREIMTRNVKTVLRNSSVKEIAQIMKEENIGIIPVVDEQRRLLGVVTDRDIVVRVLAENRNVTDLKADDIMTDDIDAVTPDEEIRDLIELMGQKQVRRVPVVDRDDRLLGIISISDIATRADYDEELQDALERISARRSFWTSLVG
jgi:CBS domain-containing protein